MDNSSAWDTFLTDCEAEIARTRALDIPRDDLDDATEAAPDIAAVSWVPPADLGPMPAQFQERARNLVAAQATAVLSARERLVEVTKQLAAVQSVPTASPSPRPIYLDVAG